ITVPFHDAQVPSAFQAVIHNNGPTANSFDLTFPSLPTGFTVLNSGTQVTIPAGQTGILGIYLQPNGSQLPSPGTQVSFSVTATSATSLVIMATQAASFTVPSIDAVALTSSPIALNTTPGSPVTVTLKVTNVGNVPETIALSSGASTGLTVSGLNLLSLGVG